MLACTYGFPEVTKMLLEKGANPNLQATVSAQQHMAVQ